MPIAYGQCKGRKYNNVQPLPEKPPEPKQPKKVVLCTCPECGLKKPPSMFRSGSKICKQCMKRR